MDTVPIFNKYRRIFKALGYACRYPTLLREVTKQALKEIYSGGNFQKKQLPRLYFHEMEAATQQVSLKNFNVRNGNVSSFELLVLAAVIAHKQPANLLEIGTFDGNTTLQMALNAPPHARVHTLDLPESAVSTYLPMLYEDVNFVIDPQKKQKKYYKTPEEQKISQHFGDSALYDFTQFTKKGLLDFCFIDGGHSYEYVRNDTEKVIPLLAPRAVVLWHDFNPNYPGVYTYLCTLGETLPIFHIHGTSLAVMINEVLM